MVEFTAELRPWASSRLISCCGFELGAAAEQRIGQDATFAKLFRVPG
jgi:hypothetical protein